MGQEKLQQSLELFKVLADENRLKLLGLLAYEEHNVDELATLLDLRPPTVSHHLTKLKAVGLVEMHAAGTTHWYRLNARALQEANKLLLSRDAMAILVEDISWDEWERRVLRDLFDGERLRVVPSSTKK